MDLVHLMDERAAGVVDDALAAMRRAHLRHYESLGEDAVRARLQALYEAVRETVRTRHLDPVLEHADAVARSRYESGFDLGEVQTAFNVLEEALWHRVTGELSPAQLAEALGLVATAIGAGKDRLARTYVSLATSTHVPALDVKALFRGTEGV
jgi:hypothetical protein